MSTRKVEEKMRKKGQKLEKGVDNLALFSSFYFILNRVRLNFF